MPGPDVHSLPEELWPTAERAAWQEARRPSIRLQRGGAASHLRPMVQRDLRKRYGLFLDSLSRSGRLDVNAPAGAHWLRAIRRLMVDSRIGAVTWAIWQRPVSHSRSSVLSRCTLFLDGLALRYHLPFAL
jgi:hypothetical protein